MKNINAHYPDPTISQGVNYVLVGEIDTFSGVIKAD